MSVGVRHEHRSSVGDPWLPIGVGDSHQLCPACFEHVGGWVRPDQERNVASRTVGSPAASSNSCDFCGSTLRRTAFSLEMVPAARVSRSRDRYRFAGQIWSFRICLACKVGSRAALYWTLGGGKLGSGAAPSFSATPVPGMPTFALGLNPRDDAELNTAAREAGWSHRQLRPADALQPDLLPLGALLFLAAGARLHRTPILDVLGPEAQARVVVVVPYDEANLLGQSLRKAPADFVTSPVERPAALATWHRVRAGLGGGAILQELAGIERPAACEEAQDCHEFVVEPARDTELKDVMWLLRRFLRPADRLVGAPGPTLIAHLHCPGEHLAAALTRLTFILANHAGARPVDGAMASKLRRIA